MGQTKADKQYEKRVVATAIILTELSKAPATTRQLRKLRPAWYSYAFNDALRYLDDHGFITMGADGAYEIKPR